MKTRLSTLVLVLFATLIVGCKSDKSESLNDAPPPSDQEVFVPAEPAPTPYNAPAAAPAPAPTAGAGGSYTVQPKDTLWSIAQRTYGDGKRWHDIVAANPGLDPQKLAVGQTIRLP